ncbi:endonuclease/exonuclease/phosphatase family protein [Nocardia sp. NPDC003345]
MSSVRVATFNVLSPLLADWHLRKNVIAEQLRKASPDIIGLQEVYAGGGREEAIADLLGPDWHIAWHSQTTPDGVGLALASRWPFVDIREHGLGVTDRAAAFPWSAVVVAAVQAPQPFGTLRIAHHKPVFQLDYEYERELQAVEAARFIDDVLDRREDHVVVVGDFDAAPDSASIRFWTGRQSLAATSVSYHDAWEALRPDDPGHTFTPDNPLVARGDMSSAAGRRIDYVLVRGASSGPRSRCGLSTGSALMPARFRRATTTAYSPNSLFRHALPGCGADTETELRDIPHRPSTASSPLSRNLGYETRENRR